MAVRPCSVFAWMGALLRYMVRLSSTSYSGAEQVVSTGRPTGLTSLGVMNYTFSIVSPQRKSQMYDDDHQVVSELPLNSLERLE